MKHLFFWGFFIVVLALLCWHGVLKKNESQVSDVVKQHLPRSVPESSSIAHVVMTEELDLSSLKNEVNRLVNDEACRTLTVENCKPDKRITTLMREIDSIGQKLMSQEKQTDDIIDLSEKCLAILAALRERRVYAYMLWAEGRIEGASRGRYKDLKSLSQSELMRLYEFLSDINISIIRENMLNREIMARLTEIYDCLDNANKPTVRIKAIQQQRDQLSTIDNVPIRKSLDDF